MRRRDLPNQKSKYNELNNRLARYVAAVQSLYDTLCLDVANAVVNEDIDEGKFKFNSNHTLKKKIEDLQALFVQDMRAMIYRGTSDEWRRSNDVQDMVADSVLKRYKRKHKREYTPEYYRGNEEALKAFQQRKDRGLNLSDKLWQQSRLVRQELEAAISCSIEKGIDAVTLSKQLSKYLVDFPSLQRDYKDKFGEASQAKDCEYRSIRLARSEINMAYRTAEQERWRQFDFVLGYEIKLSGSHPEHDVCDYLAGKYPKDFVWTGWHPNDMCYCVPLLMSEDEYFADKEEGVDKEIKGIADGSKVEEVLKGKSFMFETSEVFVGKLDLKNREAIDKLAYKLGKFNPQGEVKSFSIEDIIQTQQYVGTQNVIDIAKSIDKNGLQDNPTGIQVGCKVFVVDGHNRIAALRLSGSNTFDLRVVEVSESEWRDAGGIDPIGGYGSSKKKNGSITKSSNKVTDVPTNFKEWATGNWNRIAASEKMGTLPYFLRDNKEYYQKELSIKKAAVLRHKNRDDKAIQAAWDNRNALQDRYGKAIGNLRRNSMYWGTDISEIEEYLQSTKISVDEYGFDEKLDELMRKAVGENNRVRAEANARFARLKTLRDDLSMSYGEYRHDDIISDIESFLAKHNPNAKEMVYGASYEPTKIAEINEYIKEQKKRIKKRVDVLHTQNIAMIEDELGAYKKVPMSFDDADQLRANPMYPTGERQYRVNCQSCVVAYELRRQGFDVEALPNMEIVGSPQERLSYNTASIWIDRKTGKPPKKEYVSIAGLDDDKALSSVVDKIQVQGRYHISLTWKERDERGYELGHVFTVERKRNGTIFAYDPQNGIKSDDTALLKQYLSLASRGYRVHIYRVDNCDINTSSISKIVKKK